MKFNFILIKIIPKQNPIRKRERGRDERREGRTSDEKMEIKEWLREKV